MFNRLRHSSGESTGRNSPTRVRTSGGKNASLNLKDVEIISDSQPHNPYTEIQILSQHTDIVRLLLRIDHRRVVSAGDDGIAVIWDIKICRRLHILNGHSRPITSLLLLDCDPTNPQEDQVLLTAASDKFICSWNIESGERLCKVNSHNSSIKCLIQLRNNTLFCSGGEKLCIWNNNVQLMCTLDRPQEEADIHAISNISKSRIVTASNGQLVVHTLTFEGEQWKLRIQKRLPPHREVIRSLISVSEESFASGSIDGTVIIWSSSSLTPTYCFNSVKEYLGDERMFPFSIQLLFAVQERYVLAAVGCGFCIYDIHAGKLIAERLKAHYSKVISLQFVYEGAYLATCSEDGCIRLWGKAPSAIPAEANQDKASDQIERFLGISGVESRQRFEEQGPTQLDLLGECLGHSGAVQMVIDFGIEGMISCGVDGLVIVWKDGQLQNARRNDIVRMVAFGGGAGVV